MLTEEQSTKYIQLDKREMLTEEHYMIGISKGKVEEFLMINQTERRKEK
jgi:hypothetical protein